MIQGESSASRFVARRWVGSLTLTLIALGSGRLTGAQGDAADQSPQTSLRASQILELARSLSSVGNSDDAYLPVTKLAFDDGAPDSKGVTAFEENPFFIYVLARVPISGGSFENGPAGGRVRKVVRRFIVLRPSVFVVDDEVLMAGSQSFPRWQLYAAGMPEVTGRRARIVEGQGELFCEALLPRSVSYRPRTQPGGEPESESYILEMASQERSSRTRFLHVLSARQGTHKGSGVHSELTDKDGQLLLTISTTDRIFRLNLPAATEGAGDISISRADGRVLLDDRPLPSGVLPHGPEGVRVMEQWDADYRGKSPPVWDIGRPSKELRRAVEEGTIRPCRAVDVCCGTGTDAIYLARRGFRVTAIDIAPTALGQARQKARRAGVSVQWLLADVLAAPNLEPFDFIYDRGCYHVVRDQNLTDYLETVRRFSHPGTQFLLLASRHSDASREGGPPGVTEEELRFDFLQLFDIEWLRESRLEANRPGGMGPPSWAALMRRKAKPGPGVQGKSDP